MRRLALALALLAAGCGPSEPAVPGTTARLSEPRDVSGGPVYLRLFTEESDCPAGTRDTDRCLPYLDRSHGEVHLAFEARLRDGGGALALPLRAEHLQVFHNKALVSGGDGPNRVELVPHDPVRVSQLFVLVIDASGSMNEEDRGTRGTRMDRVRRALLRPGVVGSFFPSGANTGVVVLTFTDGRPQPLGGAIEVVDRPRRFRKLVRQELVARGGYTHLYQAVRYATGALLREDAIRSWLDTYQASPTVVVLTDGFNDERADDTCATNAERRRLPALLDHLDQARRAGQGDIRQRPTVYAVGLGRPLRPDFELDERDEEVTPGALCGRFRKVRIDGQLERRGIDNASLEWIARHGGGSSYVQRGADGLANAFQQAAAERHRWFEVRYRIDPLHLMRSFETRLVLTAFADASASLDFHPSAWFDPPPGEPGDDGWARPVPWRVTAALVMPVLGGLVAFTFLSAAMYKARRALFRRRPRKPKP